MQRNDYAFSDLSQQDYEAIITAGTMQGASPLLGKPNYDALMGASGEFNIDPRVAMSWQLWEDHFGTDPGGGVELAKVFNFGGIKWVGQAGAFDSGIPYPANEGIGTYAGFADAGGWFHALYQTLTNEYCGPYFNAGDLANAASVYITGQPNSGHGQERVDQFVYYQRHYPPQNGGATVVSGADIIAKAQQYIGQPNSDGIDGNGNHVWAYWCEAFAESIPRSLGLTIGRYASALVHGQSIPLQGGPAPLGAWVIFGTQFYAPDGHIAFSMGDGRCLGTLTDGTGVGYRNWNENTTGYMGWAYPDGAQEHPIPAPSPPDTHPIMEQTWLVPNNPYEHHADDPNLRIGIGGGFLTLYRASSQPFQTFGFPMENERQATITDADGTKHQRTIQRFERAVFQYAPNEPGPWQVTIVPENATVTPL